MSLATTLGLILICAAFSPVFVAQKKAHAFIICLFQFIGWYTMIALVSQALHIFTYPAMLIAAFALAGKQIWTTYHLWQKNPGLHFKKSHLFFVITAVLVIAYLSQVHYNYTGLISKSTKSGYEHVKSMQYPYPYYVDEWYAAAFSQHSIETNQLPTSNPLSNTNLTFINFEAAFHSFIASIFIITASSPVLHYTLLSIVINTILVSLIYVIARHLTSSSSAALITGVSALYITSSANLPSIWTLLPVTMGSIATFISTRFLLEKNTKYALWASMLALLLYPPMVVFQAGQWIVYSLQEKGDRGKLSRMLGATILFAALITASFYFLGGPSGGEKSIGHFFSYLTQTITYTSFTPNGFPQYMPWHIIPVSTIIASLIGLALLVKQKEGLIILTPFVLGCIIWAIYHHTTSRFIVEYQRVIFFTALLATTTAGLGFGWLLKQVEKKVTIQYFSWLILIATAGISLALLPSYTARTNWQQLALYDPVGQKSFKPAAPANIYLQPDDLELFKDLENRHFLSLPWKGTVIGIATNNYPASTKPGTITMQPNLYYEFAEAECVKKSHMATQLEIEYIYGFPFTCPNFVQQGTASGEGLALYKKVK